MCAGKNNVIFILTNNGYHIYDTLQIGLNNQM